MNANRNEAKRGFSLVELLAVVLVLAVLAAIAVPLYLNTRKTSAARVCKGNIASLAAAETTYATRFGSYAGGTVNTDTAVWESAYTSGTSTGAAPTGGLIGAPEGLAEIPKCPLNNKDYQIGVVSGVCTITCQDAAAHSTDTTGAATNTATWIKALKSSGNDTSNPL